MEGQRLLDAFIQTGDGRDFEAWRVDYNHRRPRSSLGHLTPNEFIAQRQALQTVEDVVCSG